MRGFFILYLFFCGILSGYSQSEELAKNYLTQGEYEKARKVYEQLLKQNPGNSNFFDGLIVTYQEKEEFKQAEDLLLQRLQDFPNDPRIVIELGHNYELQQNTEIARDYYQKALASLQNNPNYTFSVAQEFEKYSLLEYAIQAYQKGTEINPGLNFNLPLARIYGEQNKLEEMFETYLDIIDNDPEISPNIIREFDRYITEDAENPANIVLRKAVLKRLQQNPSMQFNEMLSWLFVQQKQFDRAFSQQKAIYKRNNENLSGIIQLTVLAKSAGELEASKEMISFIISEAKSDNLVLQAKQLFLQMEVETATSKDYSRIEKEFRELLTEFGSGKETVSIKIDFANFLAFKQGNPEEAIELLENLTSATNAPFQQAAIKMALADILVLDQKFNQALIYYSQVQNLVKNDEISQNARFKVAKTSYYKGDFDWAKSQLDVLKASATQLIANDAMELSLLIQENVLEDSTQTALKLYAHADLLSFQNKTSEAILVLDQILQQHVGEKIEDEALLKQAQLFEQTGEYKKAEANYLKITQLYKKGILADNATWALAKLYENQLQDPDKARDFYEQIIFNYPDSIYFVDARRKFRVLRGDKIE